jgi:signal transduction histidine kinase
MRKGIDPRREAIHQPDADSRDALAVRGLLHDVEHGLATLASLIEVIRGDTTLSEDSSLQLRRAERELSMLFSFITQWHEGTYSAAGEVDVRGIAEEIAQLAEIEHGVAVELEPGAAVSLPVSMAVVWRVLANVVDNAARAAGPAGRVEITVARDSAIVVEVRDTGPGFPATAHGDRLGANGSTGLRVVTSLLDSVGGRFEVRDSAIDGTTVRAVFPPLPRQPEG